MIKDSLIRRIWTIADNIEDLGDDLNYDDLDSIVIYHRLKKAQKKLKLLVKDVKSDLPRNKNR